VGQTQVLTPAGALPLNFEIDASSLDDAVAKFGDLARQALNDTMQRLEEMRREQASSLIVPGAGGAPGGGQPGPGGGIQIR
jgi:DNA-binding protein YbaB